MAGILGELLLGLAEHLGEVLSGRNGEWRTKHFRNLGDRNPGGQRRLRGEDLRRGLNNVGGVGGIFYVLKKVDDRLRVFGVRIEWES